MPVCLVQNLSWSFSVYTTWVSNKRNQVRVFLSVNISYSASRHAIKLSCLSGGRKLCESTSAAFFFLSQNTIMSHFCLRLNFEISWISKMWIRNWCYSCSTLFAVTVADNFQFVKLLPVFPNLLFLHWKTKSFAETLLLTCEVTANAIAMVNLLLFWGCFSLPLRILSAALHVRDEIGSELSIRVCVLKNQTLLSISLLVQFFCKIKTASSQGVKVVWLAAWVAHQRIELYTCTAEDSCAEGEYAFIKAL